MTTREADPVPRLRVQGNRPLIEVAHIEDGQDVTYYYADEPAVEDALASEHRPRALDLAGAWSDLDWEEVINALDEIRHQSPPSPPIEDERGS